MQARSLPEKINVAEVTKLLVTQRLLLLRFHQLPLLLLPLRLLPRLLHADVALPGLLT